MALEDQYVEVSSIGIQGLSGTTTAVGASGATGIQGETGATGIDGASGIQGASGATGADGATGPQGDIGATGIDGATGIQGASGATGADGAAGIDGATGVQGASGSTGLQGASGATGIQGASGSTGLTGATGVSGASGVQGASGATGLIGATGISGATGFGFESLQTFTTSSTNEIVVDTINPSVIRSARYEAQLNSGSDYSASELRLVIDSPNAFLTEYAIVGQSLGSFAAYYSLLSNSYSGADVEDIAGASFWNGTTLRIYTANDVLAQGLLAAPIETTFTISTYNDGGPHTVQNVTKFVQSTATSYQATMSVSKSPTLLVSSISWTGTGNVELRFTPFNAVTYGKYYRTSISA